MTSLLNKMGYGCVCGLKLLIGCDIMFLGILHSLFIVTSCVLDLYSFWLRVLEFASSFLLFLPNNLPDYGTVLCSVSWTPSFLLKRYVLTGIRDGPHEPFIADSVDFVVSQVEPVKAFTICSLWLSLSKKNKFFFYFIKPG